jgi:hypothetical protein
LDRIDRGLEREIEQGGAIEARRERVANAPDPLP